MLPGVTDLVLEMGGGQAKEEDEEKGTWALVRYKCWRDGFSPCSQHCGPPRIREEPSCEKRWGQQVVVYPRP